MRCDAVPFVQLMSEILHFANLEQNLGRILFMLTFYFTSADVTGHCVQKCVMNEKMLQMKWSTLLWHI